MYCHLLLTSVITESPNLFPQEGNVAFLSVGPIPLLPTLLRRRAESGPGVAAEGDRFFCDQLRVLRISRT